MSEESLLLSRDLLKRLLVEEKLKHCLDCGACTASCPVSRATYRHFNPRRLLELIALDPSRVLDRDELWLCAWCYHCYERCPQKLNIPEIIVLTRNLAVNQGDVPEGPRELVREVLASGRTMKVTEGMDDWRESVGLPRIGGTVSHLAMNDVKRIAAGAFTRKVAR